MYLASHDQNGKKSLPQTRNRINIKGHPFQNDL